jgi:hypothetical protein
MKKLELLSDVKILEVGVWKGGSVNLWAKRLPNAKVVGADIDLKICLSIDPSIVLREVDQNDFEGLQNMASDESDNGYDLIIEDGCHQYQASKTTFNALFPFVKPGGLYVVEDWGSYVYENHLLQMGKKGGIDHNMVLFIKESIDEVVDWPLLGGDTIYGFGRTLRVKKIELFPNLAVFHKAELDYRCNYSDV